MTTSSLSPAAAKAVNGSMLGILGSAGTASADAVPSEQMPADTPSFLPMLLQLLMGQKNAVPVTVKGGKQSAQNGAATNDASADSTAQKDRPVITVLTDGVDGLTRLTLEKTPASLRTLTRNLNAHAEGTDSVEIPSLSGVVAKRRKNEMEEEGKKKGGNITTTGAILDGTDATHSEPAAISVPSGSGAVPVEPVALPFTPEPTPAATAGAAGETEASGTEAPTTGQHPFYRIVSAGSLVFPKNDSAKVEQKPIVNPPPEKEKETSGVHRAAPLDERTHPVTQSAPRSATPSVQQQEAMPVIEPVHPSGDEVWQKVAAIAAEMEQTAAVPPEQIADPVSAPQQMEEVRSLTPEIPLSTERPRPDTVKSDVRPVKEGKKKENAHPLFRDAVVTMTGKEPSHIAAPVTTDSQGKEERADRPVIARQEETPAGPLKKNEEKDFARAIAEAAPVKGKETGDVKQMHGPAATSAVNRAESVKNIMEQLSRSVSVAVKEGHSEMKVVLHPDTLGEVTVRVQVEEGKVTAKLDVQQPQVKNTIEANIPQLKEALTARGLTMEHIEISTAQNGLADGASKNRQNGQRQRGHASAELVEEEQDAVKFFGYNTVEYTV